MTDNFLERLFEHNNWANQKIIETCAALSDEQLDTEPQSVTKGSIRQTLTHLAHSQRGYFQLLTLPVEERVNEPPAYNEIQDYASQSGEGLLAIARGQKRPLGSQLRTRNGYITDPWVVMLQVINHATEHREQIKSMLTALGVTPPEIAGWDYGEVENALLPIKS